MAGDMFMKIKGVEGESKDDKHKNEIDVLSWSWGARQTGSAAMGGGAGTGRVSVEDLHFVKPLDKASPDLFMKLCTGTHYDEAILTCRKAGGDSPLEFVKITMFGEVFVTGIQQSLNRGGDEGGTESVSLNFSKVKIEYTEQTEKGGEGAKPKAGFDIKAHKKL